jgi:hypothetical protein
MTCKLCTRGAERSSVKGALLWGLRECAYPHIVDRLYQDLDILCLTPYPGGAEVLLTWAATLRKQSVYHRRGIQDIQKSCAGEPTVCPDLPFINPHYIIKIDKSPCAFLALLPLHKLQGWDDRRGSRRPDFWAEIPGDIRDTVGLLRIASQLGLEITKPSPYTDDPQLLSRHFSYRFTLADVGAAPVTRRPNVQMPDEYLPPNKILFLQNLPETVTKDQLNALFSQHPTYTKFVSFHQRRISPSSNTWTKGVPLWQRMPYTITNWTERTRSR